MTRTRPSRSSRVRIAALALLALLAIVLAACAVQPAAAADPSGPSPSPAASAAPSAAPGAEASPGASPAASPSPSHLPAAAIPLEPAKPGANPIDLFAFLFTPIFWVLFNLLVVLYTIFFQNIAIAIILLTLIIRALLIAPFRRQIVSQRRMQLLQPELKELQKKYKGDRAKLLEVQQQFYRERGVSPTSGCLPMVLQFGLLIPMYTVISQGLTNYDPQAMSILPLNCDAAPVLDSTGQHVTNPCLEATAFGINWGVPEILFTIGIGISVLALISAGLQLIQTRMTQPPADPTNTDPNVKIQRQMVVFLPLISIFYGGILPAGLFLYWIFGTVFSIVQQYLILGWGSMFPIFGWHPEWAKGHQPRFPVAIPPPQPAAKGKPMISPSIDRATSASATIRPRQRGRQGRRGRRR